MGVPKFTAWLKQQQKHYNTYFIVRQPKYVDNLFIDANSTIYDVVSKLEVINEDDIINGVLKFYDESRINISIRQPNFKMEMWSSRVSC